MNIYIVLAFNLEWKGCLACTFGGEIPHVPSTVKKDTCLTVYIVLLGYYRIFESNGGPDGTYSVQLRDPVRPEPPWVPSGAFSHRGSSLCLDHCGNRHGPSM